MMDQVLKAHPNSATAHFVEAELLAKQGKFVQAQAELARAEQIAPGLPKVDPKALSKLRTLLVEGRSRPPATASKRRVTTPATATAITAHRKQRHPLGYRADTGRRSAGLYLAGHPLHGQA
jgi:hypothetical protein